MAEEIYDKKIAPMLMEIAEICKENKIPFVAVVEWEPGKVGRTELQTSDECLEIIMIRHCAKTAPNIDGYVLGLARWANQNDVNMDSSLVMQPYVENN